MTKKNYMITEEAVIDILKQLFNGTSLGNKKNRKYLTEALMTLPEHNITTMVSLALMTKEYVPMKLGDVVKHHPPSYSSTYDRDVMIDKGLMDHDGYIFGTITGDGAWNKDEPFNPYSPTITVEMFIWKDGEIITHEDKIAASQLDVISKSELPDFNNPNNLDFFNDVSKDDTHQIDSL
jgi:hypothetical protein